MFSSTLITPLLLLLLSFTPSPTSAAFTCAQPVVNQAPDSTVTIRQPIITGQSNCSYVSIQVTTRNITIVPVVSGKFTYKVAEPLMNGRYAISTFPVTDQQGATRAGPGIAKTILVNSTEPIDLKCGRPTTISPTFDKYDATVNTHKVVINGTVSNNNCPFVTIQITAQGTFTVPVVNGKWSYLTNFLIDGRYAASVRAVSDKEGNFPGQYAEARTFAVKFVMVPMAKAKAARAVPSKARCGSTEEMCRSEAAGDSAITEYQCFSDLSSNAERCGSCAGPNCSNLPYSKEVSCQKGQCLILTCQTGYVLRENVCMEKIEEFEFEDYEAALAMAKAILV